MAHNLGDPEFWLPSKFHPSDSVTQSLVSESNSGFSSPVDSSIGDTETERDADEFLTELTRRLTNSTYLSPDLWKPKPTHGLLPFEKTNTSWKVPRSPQSTLYNEKAAKITNPSQLQFKPHYQSQKPCHKAHNYVLSIPESHAYHSHQRILCHPHQQNRFVGKIQQNGVKNGNYNGHAPGLSPSAWPRLQQSHAQSVPVSWNRGPVFDNNLIRRECSGTGVFIPRPVATPPTQAPRRKQPVALKQRNVMAPAQERQDTQAGMNNEIRLPHEWTY